MRDFFLYFLITHYQTILVCVVLLFLILKILHQRQENKIIHEVNQILNPIAHDVLLESDFSAPKVDTQNIEAIKKVLQGIDLNTSNKHFKNQNVAPQKANARLSAQNIINTLGAERVEGMQEKQPNIDANQVELLLNRKQFDADFETLFSNMEKRAQLRKK